MAEGRIHSFESMGCADGPGVRFVVFLQGCPLRCVYCHNPDTWECKGGELYTEQQVLERVLRYKPYFGAQGGITLSGGEPLLQPQFTLALLKECKKAGLHTALDTSGMAGEPYWEEILHYTDLVMADLKFTTEEDYRRYSGGSLQTLERFLEAARKKPLWFRHVVVPGLTDNDLPQVLEFAKKYENLQRIELLPFRKLCVTKYRELGLPFPLENTPECDGALLDKLNQINPYKEG
ncbi:MAG: pyruvate formate lyase-activating protein [Clostridia bacterium]|nr:pyruvate formate lyase-activating protein [Clostridia bacterium]